MASRSIGTLTIDLLMKTAGLEQGATKAEREFSRLNARAVAVGTVIGTVVAEAVMKLGSAFVSMSTEALKSMDDLTKLAQSTGVAVEQLSALTYAADLSGVSQDQLGTAFVRLSRNISDANQGIGEAQKGFDALGISVKNADGTLKSADTVLGEVAGKFATFADSTEKTALAVNLFGRSGADLIPLLNAGSEGIAEMTDEARELGLVFSQEAGKQAEQFNDNLTRLNAVKRGLVMRITNELLPSLLNMSEGFVGGAKSAERLDQAARIASNGLKIVATVGTVVAAVFKTVGEAIGGTAAAIVQFATGNFSQAMNTFSAVQADVVGNITGAVQSVRGIWDDTARDIASDADDTSEKMAAPVIQTEEKVKRAGRKIVDEAARIYERVEQAIARIARDVTTFGFDEVQLGLFDIQELGAGEEQMKRAEDLLRRRKQLRDDEDDLRKQIEQDDRQTRVLDDLNLEIEGLGKSAQWISTRNALLRAGVTAESEFGQAIIATVDSLYEQGELIDRQISLMDGFRDSASDALSSVVMGTNSVKEAFADMVNNIANQITRMIANRWIEQLFGESGTTGAGSSGGLVKAIAGIFAGGRANGGWAPSNSIVEVNERGLEMATVRGRQYMLTGESPVQVTPNHALPSGAGPQVNNFNFARPESPKTQTQIAARLSYEQRRAARFGA